MIAKRFSLCIAVALIAALVAVPAYAGDTYFTNPLTSPAQVPSHLGNIDSDYTYTSAGLARTTSGMGGWGWDARPADRPMVKTLSGGYLNADFIAELTVRQTGSHAQDLIYFGFGQGAANTGYFDEPTNSIYFRIHSSGGYRGVQAALWSGFETPEFNATNLADIGQYNQAGTRFRITKIGHNVTLSIVGGGSKTYSVNNLAPGTLNGTNAHIYFGNSAVGTTFSNLVVVSPNQPPVAVAKNITVALDAFGQAVISASDINDGSYDPDGDPISLSVDKTSFACSNLGPNTVVLTVTDNKGASSSASAVVTVFDNMAPTLTVPGDVVAEGTGPDGTPVAIGTANATDNCDPNPVIANDAPAVYPLGTTVVTWTATDASGNVTTGQQQVTVQDTTPPTLTVPGDVVAEGTGPDGTPVAIGAATATDICDPNPVITNDAPAVYPLGTTVVTWTATDASGNATSGTQTVTVVDTTPPVIAFDLLTGTLWPPNHEMVLVASGISASDICDTAPAVTVTVTSNEPINGKGDGNTDHDWEIIGGNLYLRAERAGNGNGRVYTVTVVATDASGNSATASGAVNVPHSQGNAANNNAPGNAANNRGRGRKPAVEGEGVTPSVVVGEAKVIEGKPAGAVFTQGESVTVEGLASGEQVVRGEAIIAGDMPHSTGILDVNEGIGPISRTFDAFVPTPAFSLSQNYPNPFNPETVIGYALTEASDVRLAIFNALGQEVRVLVSGMQGAGQYQVRWDGRDASGHRVTSGVYLYRLQAGTDVLVRKMILVK